MQKKFEKVHQVPYVASHTFNERLNMRSLTLLVPAALLAACASTAQFDELADKVESLEQKVVALEARPVGGGGGGMSSADEAKAGDLARAMIDAYRKGDYPSAKNSFAEMRKKYAGSRAYRDRSVQKIGTEISVVGTKVASIPKPEKWYTGSDEALDVSSGTTLVVFWEEW